jgi:thiol-disulfide isomerase/thioredoxin
MGLACRAAPGTRRRPASFAASPAGVYHPGGHARAEGGAGMRRAQAIELGAGCVLLAGALGVATYWGRAAPAGRADAFAVTRPVAATAASGFELPALDGGTVRLDDFRGRVVLLNFWATWCAPCREEMPALAALATQLGPQGLVVLAVSVREPRATVEPFVRGLGLRFPVALDQEGTVTARYHVFALPTTIVVDRQGRHVGSVLGIRDWTGGDARAYVRALLAGPEA